MTIQKLAAGGDGLGHLDDGRVVFVAGALPGETVTVRLTQSKKDYAKAVVVSFLVESDHRVTPPCPEIARGCGGCGWQHIRADAQLAMKADVLIDALRRTARLNDADVRLGAAVSPWGYRTSMRPAVRPDGRLGLRAESSHDVVDLHSCMVAHPLLEQLMAGTRLSGSSEVSLRVSAATGERTIWADGARFVRVPDDVQIGPDAVLYEHVAGVPLRVSAASFFQSGQQAADLVVEAVRRAIGESLGSRHLLDAYGGIGLFSAVLGAERSTIVEGNPTACADARVNTAGASVDVVHSAVERWLPTTVDVVVADPSRAGLGSAAVDVLTACQPACFVLVSCDPVAMARDTGLMGQRGYRLEYCEVLDLFPNTSHLEVVSRFVQEDSA